MASVNFPSHLIDIMADDYQVGYVEQIYRSQFDDNYVRQAKLTSVGREVHSFNFVLKLSNYAMFNNWLSKNGANDFNFSPFMDNYQLDLDDDSVDEVMFDAKIVGGAPSVQLELRSGMKYEGESYFQGSMSVEFIRGAS